MAYAPTVNDNSGQILAGYQMQAADMRLAQQQQQAEAFANIANQVTNVASMQAGGKAFKKIMSTAGPAMGISNEEINQFKNMSDFEAYQVSGPMLGLAPSMVSATGLGNHYNSMARMNQQAANQSALRQPAPNQVPMVSGAAAGNTPSDASQNPALIAPDIQTRRHF
jgi:hypothetical protein